MEGIKIHNHDEKHRKKTNIRYAFLNVYLVNCCKSIILIKDVNMNH